MLRIWHDSYLSVQLNFQYNRIYALAQQDYKKKSKTHFSICKLIMTSFSISEKSIQRTQKHVYLFSQNAQVNVISCQARLVWVEKHFSCSLFTNQSENMEYALKERKKKIYENTLHDGSCVILNMFKRYS